MSGSVTLQSGVLAESGRGEKAQTVRENVLYYNVDKAVKPIVAYGNTLYGRSSMKQTVSPRPVRIATAELVALDSHSSSEPVSE